MYLIFVLRIAWNFHMRQAARTQQAMVPLLVRCGANPMQKD